MRRGSQLNRRGASLVELLLCLVVLGMIGTMVVPMIRARVPEPQDSPQLRLAIARRTALERGIAVTIDWHDDSSMTAPLTIWPDGHVTSDSTSGIDLITGLSASPRRGQP